MIVVSPGHGGYDFGSINKDRQLFEKDLTMFVAVRTEERLDNYDEDSKVFQLPSVTSTEDLHSVVKYAIDNKARFVYEIHVNSHSNTSASGFESFIYNEATKENERIQSVIHGILSEYCKSYGMTIRQAKKANFHVLRECHKAGIMALLVEIAFLSNPQDAERLRDIKFLDGFANESAWSITQALNIPAKTVVVADTDKIRVLDEEVRRLKQGIENSLWSLSSLIRR